MEEAVTDDKETYLGDGLYASFDGYQIKLRAPDLVEGDRIVYLDERTLEAFERYVECLKTEAEERVKAEVEKKD